MPFKSEAQRRKFYAMAERGEISKNKVKEYEEKTKGDLPERVEKDKKISAKIKAKKYIDQKSKSEHAESSGSSSR